MRLFVAIDIPDWAKDQLEDLQVSNLGMKWTSADTMHLTLRFIGDVEEESKRQRLVDELGTLDQPAFNMTIKGLGYFPPRKQPKILWAGIKENGTLMNLQEQVEQVCRSVGFEPDMRSYTPHITIGRVDGASKKEVNSYFNQHKRVRIPDIPVEEFILYESKLHSDGAVHLPLRRFGLTGQSTENEA